MSNNSLLEQMLDNENLTKAYLKVIRNKGASGVDGMKCSQLKEYLENNIEDIKHQIKCRKYNPSPVLRVEIPKDENSVRNLGIPTVVDRFIQQAITQVVEPIYEPNFSNSSYGFRPNRCCEMAIIKALEYMDDGYDWIVDIDLEKFFDTVKHDRLMSLLDRNIKDGDVMSLIRKYLVSGIQINGKYTKSIVGMPQGGNLSPVLSNVVLNELDVELHARGLLFVRYADDCIIMVKSEKSANRVMKNVTKFIEGKLGLKVNVSKSKVARPKDIKFLGFGFYSTNEGYKTIPHSKSINKLKIKLKELTSRRWSVSMDYRLLKIKQLIIGWVNYYRITTMKKVCEKIDAHTRFRLRMCIWKQWKKTRKRYNGLQKLGITKSKAWEWANSRKGYARVANSFILCKSITNEILKKRGLASLLVQYKLKHI